MGSGSGKGGSEGEGAQHKTAYSSSGVFLFFFYSTLKGGWQWICSRKGFGSGDAHPLSTKACVSFTAASFFYVQVLCPLLHSSEQQLLHLDFLPTTQHEGVAALRQISVKACGSTSLSSRQYN